MNVLAIRKKLGLTIAEFCRALGVAPRTMYRWESKESPPVGMQLLVLQGIDDALRNGNNDPKTIADLLQQSGVRNLVAWSLTR